MKSKIFEIFIFVKKKKRSLFHGFLRENLIA